ncbi:MAG: ATP-binding protein [Candidatus Microsaccharimonas sp.]
MKIRSIFSTLLNTPNYYGFVENSKRITIVILAATFFVSIALTVLLIVSVVLFHNYHVAGRIVIGLVTIFYLSIAGYLITVGHHRISSWMLIVLYSIIASAILLLWSINAPIGILLMAFIIFLAGIMLGANRIIPVTLGVVILISLLQFLDTANIFKPDREPLYTPSNFGDVASYGVILAIFALIAWLAGREMEDAIKNAKDAQTSLAKQKQILIEKLDERTRFLRKVQLDEMKQLYHFAELGQLTTVILHDLANYLSVLTLDIDDLKEYKKRDSAIMRAEESIQYIDKMITSVRIRLRNDDRYEIFNATKTILQSTKEFEIKCARFGIKLTHSGNRNKSVKIFGDSLRLSQCLNILINNALDASIESKTDIIISSEISKKYLRISVTDFGTGISKPARKDLFSPLISGKKNGMGIGLYITKQIIETHFKGQISLNPDDTKTEFSILIPRSK